MTREKTRYGCFLSDLTGLASGMSAGSPGGVYGDLLINLQGEYVRSR